MRDSPEFSPASHRSRRCRPRASVARAAALLAVAAALAVAAPARAAVLVSNIDQTATNSESLTSTKTVVQGFTTGSNASGYTLASIEVKFGAAPGSALRVRLFEAPFSSTATLVAT